MTVHFVSLIHGFFCVNECVSVLFLSTEFLFELRNVELCTCEFDFLIQCSLPFCKSECCIYYMPQRLCNCTILFYYYYSFFLLVKLLFIFLVDVNCRRWFCGNRKPSSAEGFLYFLDNDMDLWVEFWKFVSKCFQVFTWPYVYISLWNFRKGMYSNWT